MVFVPVRDDDRLDVVHTLAQVREVGQHEVDAHHLRGREPQPAVDDDETVVVLDDREVLPDLADAAQREDAQLAAHAAWAPVSNPCRSRVPRMIAISRSSASTIGSRRPPTSWPSRPSAVFTGVGLVVQNMASNTSRSEAAISARRSGSSNIRRISFPTTWLETQMPPAQPRSSGCA